MRILVVEDSEDSRTVMTEVLEGLGHETRSSCDGLSAIAKVLSWHPDLVFIDIGLPDIDGYEVARRVRREPSTSSIQLVALTGYGYDADRKHALACGFNSHVLKPISLEALETLLRKEDEAAAGLHCP